jgi:hypothetical protein
VPKWVWPRGIPGAQLGGGFLPRGLHDRSELYTCFYVGWALPLRSLAALCNLYLVCQVYGLPSLSPIGRFGGRGSVGRKFDFSTAGGHLCFCPEGSLLVCEGDNRRVQAVKLGRDADDDTLTTEFKVCMCD